MKKSLAIGMISLALAAAPALTVAAAEVDNISVTVSASCTLARQAYASGGVTNNTSHKNGTDGTWSTTAGNNTLSATRSNSTVTYALGSSQFKVVCNNASGYNVSVATTALVHSVTNTITIPNNNNFSASVSGWAPLSAARASGIKYTNGAVVKTESTTTSGTTFEIFYGVGISASQAAGTYTGTATYTIAAI